MGNWCTKVPDIRLLTEDIILYWKSRAIEVIHPILRGRYIGLYCEFVTIVTGKTADFSSIDLCALSLIDSVEQQVNGNGTNCTQAARLLQRDSIIGHQYLLLCEEICRLCAAECSKHDHEHCRQCAVACEECADACHANQETINQD